MNTVSPSTICPVCGYDLGFKHWRGNSPSGEICPSCGIQFGYYDATPDGHEGRLRIYKEWQRRWIEEGMPWNGKGQPPPAGWNPTEQLKKIG